MSDSHDIAEALGGEVVGGVVRDGDVWRWTCDCGDTGTNSAEYLAATALYFHRRSGHRKVDVQMPVIE